MGDEEGLSQSATKGYDQRIASFRRGVVAGDQGDEDLGFVVMQGMQARGAEAGRNRWSRCEELCG